MSDQRDGLPGQPNTAGMPPPPALEAQTRAGVAGGLLSVLLVCGEPWVLRVPWPWPHVPALCLHVASSYKNTVGSRLGPHSRVTAPRLTAAARQGPCFREATSRGAGVDAAYTLGAPFFIQGLGRVSPARSPWELRPPGMFPLLTCKECVSPASCKDMDCPPVCPQREAPGSPAPGVCGRVPGACRGLRGRGCGPVTVHAEAEGSISLSLPCPPQAPALQVLWWLQGAGSLTGLSPHLWPRQRGEQPPAPHRPRG